VVIELEDARVGIGDRELLSHAELWLERGEHVSIVGPNGCGKSTLVETLSGARELESGKLRRGHNVRLAYLPQHDELPARPEITVLAHAQRATGLSEARTRALLGRFLFSGEEAQKSLTQISGGEARRLALAILVSSDANVLVLDEPTNHLDLESREALEDALRRFKGAVLLISHDRALLEAIGERTIAFAGGTLESHPGGWAAYRAARESREAGDQPRARPRRGGGRSERGPSKNRRAAAERLEREVEAAEARLRALEDELADPSMWADPSRSSASARRHESARRELEELYERWEETLQRIDA
jgi:ATP-binding cassette subfamily F protein 3